MRTWYDPAGGRSLRGSSVRMRPGRRRPDDEVGMRQQAGCTGHVALCHQAADDGGADLFGVHVAFADFHDLQSKAVAAQIVVTALLGRARSGG